MKTTLFKLLSAALVTVVVSCGNDDSINEENCFSPEQNLDMAEFGSDKGCNCESEGETICVNALPFLCKKGKWELSPAVSCESKLSCNNTPLSDLDWLNKLIETFTDPKVNSVDAEIKLYDYKDEQIFVIDYCGLVQCVDSSFEILNCNGKRICQKSGGIDDEGIKCESVLKEATNPRIIYPKINSSTCDKSSIVNADLYKEDSPSFYTIYDVNWNGKCLEIEYTSGGCSGYTWITELIDSGAIMESLPIQRNVKLHLKNEEVCLAIVRRTDSFNVDHLFEDSDEITLNIEGFKRAITIKKNVPNDIIKPKCTTKPITSDKYSETTATVPISLEVVGSCLYVTFEASKYININTDVQLLDSGIQTKSLPPIIPMKLVINDDLQRLPFEKYIVGFDMSDQIEHGSVYINLGTKRVLMSKETIPDTREDYKIFINEKRKAIEAMIHEISCDTSEDWKIIGFGSKPCGGPWEFLAYPSTLEKTNFLEKIEQYNAFEAEANSLFGIVSDCSIADRPDGIECKEGKPHFIYYTTNELKDK